MGEFFLSTIPYLMLLHDVPYSILERSAFYHRYLDLHSSLESLSR